MSVIDDSALDYEEDEESSIAINPADEDTLLEDDGDEAELDAVEGPEGSGEILDVQLSDDEMAEFPVSETPGPPEAAKPAAAEKSKSEGAGSKPVKGAAQPAGKAADTADSSDRRASAGSGGGRGRGNRGKRTPSGGKANRGRNNQRGRGNARNDGSRGRGDGQRGWGPSGRGGFRGGRGHAPFRGGPGGPGGPGWGGPMQRMPDPQQGPPGPQWSPDGRHGPPRPNEGWGNPSGPPRQRAPGGWSQPGPQPGQGGLLPDPWYEPRGPQRPPQDTFRPPTPQRWQEQPMNGGQPRDWEQGRPSWQSPDRHQGRGLPNTELAWSPPGPARPHDIPDRIGAPGGPGGPCGPGGPGGVGGPSWSGPGRQQQEDGRPPVGGRPDLWPEPAHPRGSGDGDRQGWPDSVRQGSGRGRMDDPPRRDGRDLRDGLRDARDTFEGRRSPVRSGSMRDSWNGARNAMDRPEPQPQQPSRTIYVNRNFKGPTAPVASVAPDQPRPPVWESAPFEEAPRESSAIFRTIQNAPGAAGGQSVTHALPRATGQPLQPGAGPGRQPVAAASAGYLPGALAAGNAGYPPASLAHPSALGAASSGLVSATAGLSRSLPAGLAASVPAPAPVVVPVLVNTALPPPGFPSAAPAPAPAPAPIKKPSAPILATAPDPATNAVDKFTQEFIQSNHRSLYGGGRREANEHASSHSRERSPLRSSHHRSTRDRDHDRSYQRDYERDYQRDYDGRSSRQARDRSPPGGRQGSAPAATEPPPPPPPPPPYHQETETEEMRQYRREYEVREAEWRARKEKALKVKELRRQLRQAEAEAGLAPPEPTRPKEVMFEPPPGRGQAVRLASSAPDHMPRPSAHAPAPARAPVHGSHTHAAPSHAAHAHAAPTHAAHARAAPAHASHVHAAPAHAAHVAPAHAVSGAPGGPATRKRVYRIQKDAAGNPVRKFELDPVTREVLREVPLVGAPLSNPGQPMSRRVVLPNHPR